MECRICFGSDHPETMLRPCRCRGTSAYIHDHCLRTYFQYYPDRFCRVCHELMEHPWMDIERNLNCAMILVVWSLVLLGMSPMMMSLKLLCFATLVSLLVFHVRRKQLTYGTTFACLLASGILMVTSPTALPLTVLLVYALLVLASLCLFMSVELVFLVIVFGLALTYSALLTFAVATRTDPAFTGLFLLALSSFWLVFLRPNTRNHL